MYITDVHFSTVDAEFFAALVLFQRFFKTSGWIEFVSPNMNQLKSMTNIQASSTAARLNAISGSSGAREAAILKRGEC